MSSEDEEKPNEDDDLPPTGGDREMKRSFRARRIKELIEDSPYKKKIVMTDKFVHYHKVKSYTMKSHKRPIIKRKSKRKTSPTARKRHKKR